ncbi:Hypothetical predicted protein [Octopus vulgaris]|uniref:Uncharacterized protein n=1 Tax=Octopus vulgaris TaxID=6645 RepID=A0AA36BCM3_OCTVU|nr:Hypothetical predicted protein [Octopus vulgaris]
MSKSGDITNIAVHLCGTMPPSSSLYVSASANTHEGLLKNLQPALEIMELHKHIKFGQLGLTNTEKFCKSSSAEDDASQFSVIWQGRNWQYLRLFHCILI